MSESIIIHIGYHKSASTLFQKKIFTSLPAEYLTLRPPHLAEINFAEDFNIKAFRKNILEAFPSKKKEFPLKIISHEQLSGHHLGYNTIDPYQTAIRIKETFPNAKIFILVRNQLRYIASLYTYRVAIKGYERRSFSTFLAEEIELGLEKSLLYDRLVKEYQILFGHSHVCVLPIELLKFDEEKFKQLFFDFFELSPQELDTKSRLNESTKLLSVLRFWRISNYIFNVLFFIYKIFVKDSYKTWRTRTRYYDFKRIMTPKLNRILKRGKALDMNAFEEYHELLNDFSASNKNLEELIGLDLKKLGYLV